jgi:bifunctional UDP-N-acetylglucosamine pyrophosphorylase/glucosamine-1-phosphate N-acetyltransferase
MLEYVVRAVGEAQAAPVSVVVGHGGSEVAAAFSGQALSFLTQEPQNGTGHALMTAAGAVAAHPELPVLVVNGDLPLLRGETLLALVERHRASGAKASLLTTRPGDPGAYGRVVRDPAGRVLRIVEAKDASPEERALTEVNAGVYVFEAQPLEGALKKLQPNNAQKEYYLTDLVEILSREGSPVGAIELSDPDEVAGVNTLGELALASRVLRERRLQSLLESGVLIEDPETTHVGADCEVAPDATLRAYTFLEGRTRVARGAQVGPFVRLVSVEVGEGAQILDHCLLRESVVEAGASVGPFAHVRPESRIAQGAKVGNFVELKKTSLGRGSKAQHLSYLGDATIGAEVNIGAGTITCNYDGTHKHKTQIGDGAFVGSDSTLVAPVSVGAGAYVGAGSTITEDVPGDSLALGRARQVVKPGWAKARRK